MGEIDSRTRVVALGGVLVIGVLALIVVVFLPPIHLLQRLQDGNYSALSAENPLVSHQDGIQIVAAPDDLHSSFSVKFDSVPQLNFLEGSAGDELRRAAESLPANLVVKSPYYKISTKGTAPDSTIIAVDIPNNAEPWETLDLYTWTGENWQWTGGRVDADRELIMADVGSNVPESVVVMQVGAIPPAVSTELPLEQPISGAANSQVTHLLLTGLELGETSGIIGDLARLPVPSASDSFAMMPSLRNWSGNKADSPDDMSINVNQAAVADMLATADTRQMHIDNIVALVVGQGYAGIDLDYRGISVDWRDNYSSLVSELATVLHAQGKMVSVAVEAPTPTPDGGWDTGGYDWRALGQVADIVRAPFSASSKAYAGGSPDYMTWALGQISRYRLFPILSTYSSDQVGDRLTLISRENALMPLSDVTGPDGAVVSPGDIIKVDLMSEALDTLQHEENSQTYSYSYADNQGSVHRVTLVTAASLSKLLDSSMRHHVGGVFVEGMLELGRDPALADIVRQFASGTPPTASDELRVVWTVESTAGGQLAREDRSLSETRSFEWTAPDAAGEYFISAALTSEAGGQSAPQSSVSFTVMASEPADTSAVTETLTSTLSTEPSEPSDASSPADCLNSTYVSDVTVPDNTHFEKGESFVKTWRVRNSGSCPWPDDAKLALVDGDALGAPQSVAVEALEAGGTTDLSVDMVAPDADGSFRGIWRLVDGSGNPFGTRLTVVIKAGEVTSPPPSAPPPSGGGGGFELGGHIRTWNYVSQMKYAGMSWAKVQIHFGQDAAGWVQAAQSQGLKIQLSALGSPAMVNQPNFHADYSAWVASLAAAGANAIEVWNEPNIDREWQAGQISPAAYTQLLCASYSAIKAANPNTAVISAAPAPTGWFGGCSGNGCDDQPWMEGLYNAGAANCMDYIGAHHNSGATSPSARSGHPADGGDRHHSWYFLPQTELYYNIFRGSRKLFYTEMGYASQEGVPVFSDKFAWARGTNNAQQAAWLAEAVNLSRSTGMVANIIVWNIDFVRFDYDPQDGYAIIRPGGSCPACDSLRTAMQ